jgi:hypothetical protein
MHFEVNQTVSGNFPTIEVDGDLPIGRHQFQLVVEDAQGQVSAPTIFTFTVFQPPIIVGPRPIVIDPIGPGPRPVGPIPIGPDIREAQPSGAARRAKFKTPKKK